MKTHMELSLENDIERIRNKVSEMGQIVEQALQDCIKVIVEDDHKLTYTIILRDQNVNEKEMEIDRLCLEFLIRQQPVSLPLRFAYSTIKINLEMERVGDYAESIARQLMINLTPIDAELKEKIVEIGMLAKGLFHDAVKAFTEQDIEQARKCIDTDDLADSLRCSLDEKIAISLMEQKISYALHASLITVVRRFERVCDQACNICKETLYMCTGEYTKHPGAEFFRVLFIDHHNSCLSLMAEAIAQEQKQVRFIFSSAGIEPQNADQDTVAFMKNKGIDISTYLPKAINQIPHLDHYQVIVMLDKEAGSAFPKQPRNVVFLDWHIKNPPKSCESGKKTENVLEDAYTFLYSQINELIMALNGSVT